MARSLSTVSTTSHSAQSVMARILATENIRVVVDPTMTTAAFDLKNRTLLLPQWKDMSKTVYDMLIGHEISHALHTPAQGWRETCEKISGTTNTAAPAYRTASLYLNIVEDARIERLIQIKFPGFRRDFVGAYNELNAKDFFGIKGQNMNALGFADRINLYYKLGTIGSVGISFNAQEDAFIRRIDSATTFADAAKIAEDLFHFCNEQKHNNQQQPPQCNPPAGAKSDAGKGGQGQGSAQDSGESKSDDKNTSQSAQSGSAEGDEKKPASGAGPTQDDSSGDQQQDGPQGDGKTPGPVGSSHSHSDAPPAPVTQEAFNRNIERQIEQATWNKDLRVPTRLVHCNLDRVVIDCKKIVETARADAKFLFDPSCATPGNNNYDIVRKSAIDRQAKFTRDSKKQVDLLIKQFELRKAAQIAKRESVRKTGILDTVRMVNYKHSEDIFRRNTMLPEGKNHGLVMFVDWSGSMGMCLQAVIEQTMVLVEFCRRMQIPYEVFAFTTRTFDSGIDPSIYCEDDKDIANRKGQWKEDITGRYGNKSDRDTLIKNGYETPNSHSQFKLLNLFSSRLTRTEHQDMLLFLRALTSRDSNYNTSFYLGNSRWELSGTALDESIVAAMQIVPAFKDENNLDIVNTIFLTDGETSVPYITGTQLFDPATKAVYSEEMFRIDANDNHSYSTDVLLYALRDITKANVVGMYLTPSSNSVNAGRFFRKELLRRINMVLAGKANKDSWTRAAAQREATSEFNKQLSKQFSEDNCLIAEPNTTGYSEFYIIKSTARVLGDENDALDNLTAGATQNAIKKAFLKSFENKNKSRVLINRFMELIAR